MSEIIDKFYTPLLTGHGFIRDPDNQQYGDLGICWKLSPEVGEGTYWTYGQKDLYDIKIHNFSFHEDFMLEFSLPECLSITRYDSISGEELSPYRRLSAGCIKTFIGGYTPYKALIHKNIPIRSVSISIMPDFYNSYLREKLGGEYVDPRNACKRMMLGIDFPQLVTLLKQIRSYSGNGVSAKLFYEGKVLETLALILEQAKQNQKQSKKISITKKDEENLKAVSDYIDHHFGFSISVEQLCKIAYMGNTTLKTKFKEYFGCNITDYIIQRRVDQAQHLLMGTELSIAEIAQAVGYDRPESFAKQFQRITGLLPREYRKMIK